jgi:D-proline reductase (dithiol) PrdB
MSVDSFKFLPRIISYYYQQTNRQSDLPIPWTPLKNPARVSKFGLVTSAGIYLLNDGKPFDLKRERREKIWGDPSYRKIPTTVEQGEIGISHLHYNPRDVLIDYNILLPCQRFQALAAEGSIGGLANYAFSFMGFQGFPPDTTEWQTVYGIEVAEHLLTEEVDCVLLTPA